MGLEDIAVRAQRVLEEQDWRWGGSYQGGGSVPTVDEVKETISRLSTSAIQSAHEADEIDGEKNATIESGGFTVTARLFYDGFLEKDAVAVEVSVSVGEYRNNDTENTDGWGSAFREWGT